MAASAPAPNNVAGWSKEDQGNSSTSEDHNTTKNLEMGMSGMSLVSGFDAAPSRKGTGSTVSSSPDDREDYSSHHQQQPSVEPGSPESEKPTQKQRPVTVPSPIGHSKNTSATSPLLTLTPNSSVDGNSTADWHSLGRQASPFTEGPSMPNLQGDHRRSTEGGGMFGSFDLQQPNDGLLGLQALRDRAHSSPGPVVEGNFPLSPSAAARGYVPAHDASSVPDRNRMRPPLSHPNPAQALQSHSSGGGGGGDASSQHSADNNSRYYNANNISLDSGGSERGGMAFGAIGRPELRQSAAEFDPRRRASSTDNLQQQQQQLYNDMAQKFGSLPTLNAHIAQQHQQPDLAAMERPRHVRSVSQPLQQNSPHYAPPPGMQQQQYMYDTTFKQGSSRASMSHPSLQSSSYDGGYGGGQGGGKRASMPGYVQSHPNLSRRDALEFQLSPHTQGSMDSGFSGPPSMISPGHSPMQTYYGGSSSANHSRNPSDAGSGILSSSPMSNSGMRPRVQSGPIRRQSDDDDLAHPLVGEHIEVPDEHGGISSAFLAPHHQQQQPHPLMRPHGHGHSLSMDQMGYHESQLQAPHLPTAGSALPMPKVIYAVKFKRTQRNFVLGPRINRDLKIGTYVKVEADRGEDLGILVGKVPAEKYSFSGRSSFTAGMGPSGGAGIADLKRIIRLATHDEVSLLSLKREEEEELLKICRGKVRQRGLPMHVVDAEYQFDRHKLTFFFEAEGRVDFRELVRDLFSMYKTRIWMQQLDKNTSTSSPAIMAPQTANMQMDYGTPIIAPPSEFADSIIHNSLGG